MLLLSRNLILPILRMSCNCFGYLMRSNDNDCFNGKYCLCKY